MANTGKTYSFVILEREANLAKKYVVDNIHKPPMNSAVNNIRKPREFRQTVDGKGFIQRTLEFDVHNEDHAKQFCDHLGLEFSQQHTMYVI